MERVIFIVHTEYHLMETIGYITHYFPNSLYDTYIVISSVKDGGRIKSANLNFEALNIKVVHTTYEYESYFSLHNKCMINKILNLNPDILFIFSEFHFWKQYLVSKLHKKGCKIILAPDGANVYSDSQFTIINKLKYLIKFVLINLTNLTIPPLFINRGRFNYAYLKYIDEVWVDNANLFKNRNKHKLISTLNFGEKDSLREINKLFSIDELSIVDNCILYVDQPMNEISQLYEIIDIINDIALRTKFPVYIKLHPNTKDNQAQLFKQQGFTILFNKIPAELYIQNLRDSIVLSLYSTALFLNNKSCRFYWIYPIFDNYRNMLKLENPTDHIYVVSNKSEII